MEISVRTHLIEEDDGIGTPAHRLRQLPTLIEAHIPCTLRQEITVAGFIGSSNAPTANLQCSSCESNMLDEGQGMRSAVFVVNVNAGVSAVHGQK
jgi:hypothetical protein